MARCEVCGKDTVFGIRVSHSHGRTNRTQESNVRRVKATASGSPEHIYTCTRHLYSNKVTRVV